MEGRVTTAGIWSVGTYLPPILRTNDYWAPDIVETWRARQQRNLTRAQGADDGALGDGARTIIKHMMRFKDDPFEGVVSRHIMPDDMRSSDMEMAAAKQAMERAGIGPGDVDMLLVQTTTPDWLHVPTAVRLHHELGLAAHCHTLQTDGMCNAFMQQLLFADAMIRVGRIRIAVVVQGVRHEPVLAARGSVLGLVRRRRDGGRHRPGRRRQGHPLGQARYRRPRVRRGASPACRASAGTTTVGRSSTWRIRAGRATSS
jgi:hypothetical protein